MASTPASPTLIALGDPRQFETHARGARVDHQAVGMDFYERRWPMNALGSVRYLQGPHSFDIPRVSGIMGPSNPDVPDEGIYAWHVRCFAMDGERIAHELARDRLFELCGQLLRAGWRRYLDRGDPRLAGEQALQFFLEQMGGYALDPRYPLDLQRWMEVNRHLPSWTFWADGVYLTVDVIDEPALRHLDMEGVYMFSLNIQSEADYFRPFFKTAGDMARWKQLLPAALDRVPPLRAQAEAELRERGYVIDETYRDPPILALGQG